MRNTLPLPSRTSLLFFLSKIETTAGKYAINGNHDYKYKNFNTIIEQSGFTNLNDSYDQIYKNSNNYILLSGISTNLHGDKTLEEKLESTTTFINSISDEEKNNTFLALKNASGYIRREIGQRINLRYNPQIIFEIDDSINYGMHIEELIHKVKGK